MDKTKTTRNTAAKTAVLEILTQSKIALSHTEIQKQTNDLCDRVTIYRILDRLVNDDIIHKIVNLDGTVKYAKCHHHAQRVHIHNHAHFSCEKCLEITCLENVKPSYIIPHNYKVNEINFTLSGLCPNCLNSNN
ncbi:Fur family transcriptional regulator [Flavobacterium hercynium]|uniref:Fur family transcriptional regulator n=1 Tax=Flavobacterium hercynium TaxID=387094 RepID=A0A226HLN9_9FLAO|nr:Fur family transcriptional regulator [Flavobacterium hercynium]OXA94768.1 Fur family transcriptional regulator [Flavobacterium hercynium]SMP07858.1 Fur family transcriptional regulator, ferric uptake regulator [Flavobacterium hercynium]